MGKNQNYQLIFLNQVTGPLFRELVEDMAQALGESLLITGDDKLYQAPREPNLITSIAPAYDRSNLWRRFRSWMAYFFVAVYRVFKSDKKALLFIVSNPPFLGLLGYFLSRLRGQRYVVLVYDLYPGLLEGVGKIKKGGIVSRGWTWFNRLIWSRATLVFTIGNYMLKNIEQMMDGMPNQPEIVSIHNWADGKNIKPRMKADNWFAVAQKQTEKLTVMYSGNVGGTHNLSCLLTAARAFSEDKSIHFLIIGGGVRWSELEQEAKSMNNVTLLPFQPEEHLPFTLTTADVAVVTLEAGVEGYSVPSKTYYALAAGAALLAMSQGPNELTQLIETEQCGVAVAHQETEAMIAAIKQFKDDPIFLARCQENARRAMEQDYSRCNTKKYVVKIKEVLTLTVEGLA
jgi:glycosyltransferase involved in cell wall biosynthesis